MKCISRFANDFELIKTLVINALKTKYKRSKLGLSWSMLNPILNITVVSFVFAQIMGMPYSKFVIFYFSGFLAWTLFSNSLLQSSSSLINNEGLIKKVPINLMIFPLVCIGTGLVEFLLSLIVLTFLLFFIGLQLTPALLFLPISLLLLVLFTTGVSLIFSVMTAFFRDIAYILTVIMQLWFYLTPVLYPKKFLLDRCKAFSFINPMVTYIDLFRDPIVNGHLPSNASIIMAVSLSVFFIVVGLAVFNKYKTQIIFKL